MLAPGATVPMDLPSLIMRVCTSLVEFLQTIVPPLGTCTGLGLNAFAPAELMMFTVVLVGAGGALLLDGAVGAGVPPPFPPHADAHNGTDMMVERRILFMLEQRAIPMPPACLSDVAVTLRRCDVSKNRSYIGRNYLRSTVAYEFWWRERQYCDSSNVSCRTGYVVSGFSRT